MLSRAKIWGIVIALAGFLPSVSASGFTLITAEEAKLPQGGPIDGEKALIPGPTISVLFPRRDATSTSPILFFVGFKPYGRTAVNLDSLRITYIKKPSIDLTQRVRNFIKLNDQGFKIENAEVPPGTHVVRIEIEDREGRPGSQVVVFTTLP
jgi:hypothetical protein